MMKSWQKKLLIYGASGLFCGIAGAIVSALAAGETPLYAIFWGMLFCALGATVARVVYHLSLKDYAPEMWQITVYILLACAGWTGGILSTTWGWTTFSLSLMCVGILMAVGTRFCKSVAVTKVKSSLEYTLRYQFMNDVLGGTPNLDAPLTLILNGRALTVDEAEKAGKTEAAEKGRAYIKKITEGK